ncbi:MAG: abhydrolase domain-containing 18 [Myxococcales bacterium]|nr:MAG: abhydrolase domain-containing 18 [Myxococcales bacterium]
MSSAPGRLATATRGSSLLAEIAAGIDSVVLRGARAIIDRTIMPDPAEAESLRASAAFYTGSPFDCEPRRFFAFLDDGPAAAVVEVEPLGDARCGASREGLRFESRYAPVNPDHLAVHQAAIANHVAHAERWYHAGARDHPTIVALHGFGTGYPSIDATALMASDFYAAGFDVILFTLPLHGRRTPEGVRLSGRAFASTDVAEINEALGQAVHDISALVRWVRHHSGRPLGLVGISLGGYVASLMAGLSDELDFVIPIIAPVCFGDLAHRFMAASTRYRSRPAALAREEFQAAYRVHSPLTYELRLSPDRALIVAGLGDRIVPAEHPQWLWAHWGEPGIYWFAGSHVAPFGRKKVFAEIRAFLARLGL